MRLLTPQKTNLSGAVQLEQKAVHWRATCGVLNSDGPATSAPGQLGALTLWTRQSPHGHVRQLGLGSPQIDCQEGFSTITSMKCVIS